MIPMTIPTAISPMPHAGTVFWSNLVKGVRSEGEVVGWVISSPHLVGPSQYMSPGKWQSWLMHRHSGLSGMHSPDRVSPKLGHSAQDRAQTPGLSVSSKYVGDWQSHTASWVMLHSEATNIFSWRWHVEHGSQHPVVTLNVVSPGRQSEGDSPPEHDSCAWFGITSIAKRHAETRKMNVCRSPCPLSPRPAQHSNLGVVMVIVYETRYETRYNSPHWRFL